MRDKILREIVDVITQINQVLSKIYDHVKSQREINKLQVDVIDELDKRISRLERKLKK